MKKNFDNAYFMKDKETATHIIYISSDDRYKTTYDKQDHSITYFDKLMAKQYIHRKIL